MTEATSGPIVDPDGTAVPGPAVPASAASARTEAHRVPFGVVLGARTRGGTYDVVVHQDTLLLARVADSDPVLMWAVLGALVGSVIGAVIGALSGRRAARKRAAERLQTLLYASPEHVLGLDSRNRLVRVADVRFTRFIEYGNRERAVVLRMRQGPQLRLRFDAKLQSNTFARDTLRVALAPRIRVERHHLRGVSVATAALSCVVVLLAAAALPLAFVYLLV